MALVVGFVLSRFIKHRREAETALDSRNWITTGQTKFSDYMRGDYLHINSSLGDSAPKNILVAPFLFDKELTGVLEFASFSEFSESEMVLLDRIGESLAIAFNSAYNRQDMLKLPEESQRQSEELEAQTEELQSQQEKLKNSNEELEQQSDELRSSNFELEEQKKSLDTRINDNFQTFDPAFPGSLQITCEEICLLMKEFLETQAIAH